MSHLGLSIDWPHTNNMYAHRILCENEWNNLDIDASSDTYTKPDLTNLIDLFDQ